MGRVARNVSGTVIMYADTLTSSMKKLLMRLKEEGKFKMTTMSGTT